MITEDYCSFEVAKLLKEKGFDEFCLASYNAFLPNHKVEESKVSEWGKANQIYRPTLQMAMKWLREVHNIYMEIAPTHSVNGPINFIWQTYDSDYLVTGDCDIFYPTYEEAVEAVIKYCLENLI